MIPKWIKSTPHDCGWGFTSFVIAMLAVTGGLVSWAIYKQLTLPSEQCAVLLVGAPEGKVTFGARGQHLAYDATCLSGLRWANPAGWRR